VPACVRECPQARLSNLWGALFFTSCVPACVPACVRVCLQKTSPSLSACVMMMGFYISCVCACVSAGTAVQPMGSPARAERQDSLALRARRSAGPVPRRDLLAPLHLAPGHARFQHERARRSEWNVRRGVVDVDRPLVGQAVPVLRRVSADVGAAGCALQRVGYGGEPGGG
jgi:hypothetical protein